MLLLRHSNDRDPMRLVLALMFVAATIGPASAQGSAQGTSSKSDEVLRQRILLKERFNKGWDVQIENAQDQGRVEGRCKAEARRRFSVLHPVKRRKFVRDCIERKGR